MLACAALSIVIVALVVMFLGIRAVPVVREIGLRSFFGSTNWDPDAGIGFGTSGGFGALTPIGGSVVAVGLALIFSVPVALAVALAVVEVAPRLGERVIRPAVEVFVGIPSVVYGWIGLTTLLPVLRHFAGGGNDGAGYLAAALVLAVMVLPTIATLAADALQALPPGLKEGSYALGATQWQTIRRVQLPAARSGILSGIVLGLARAMGEALAVALVIGDVNRLPDFAHHGVGALVQPGTTMTVTITDGINNLAINPQGTAARYMLGLVLLLIVFISISVIRALGRRGTALV
ncbi:MAG: phosphate ABC transporter permease subunit PstC [Candidatus Dormibacteria bacterium]